MYRGFLGDPGAISADASQPTLEAPISVTSTIARSSYGFVCQVLFREGVHREEDAYIDEHDGRKFARGQMAWYITKVICCPQELCFLLHSEHVMG